MGMPFVRSLSFSVRWGSVIVLAYCPDLEWNDSVFLVEFQGGRGRALYTELVLKPLTLFWIGRTCPWVRGNASDIPISTCVCSVAGNLSPYSCPHKRAAGFWPFLSLRSQFWKGYSACQGYSQPMNPASMIKYWAFLWMKPWYGRPCSLSDSKPWTLTTVIPICEAMF